MSFQNYKHNKQYNYEISRKEKDSFFAHHFIKNSLTLKERASSSTSQGSITVEAALTAGLFLFGVLCLVYLFEIMAIQTSVKSALHSVSREVAEESYVSTTMPVARMEKRLVQLIGEDRLDNSLIVGGGSGLDCSGSKKYGNTTIMDLNVRYQIEIPIMMFHLPIITKEETIRVKGWTGKDTNITYNTESVIVYVTDYGIVYHADINCSYLELSVRTVDETNITELRNANGEKYKACSSCKNSLNNSSTVYVTDYGNKYHQSLDCSKIKRNMHAIPIEEVYGLGGCSKCVK